MAATVVVLGALAGLSPRRAWGHDMGTSQSELTLDEAHPGAVHARVVLAAADVEGELQAFADEGLALTTETGAACTLATPMVPRFDEGDGLRIEGDYACPDDAAAITATYYFLSRLSPSHRHLATFTVGETTTQRLLTATNRALTVTMPPPLRRRDAALSVGLGSMRVRVTPTALCLTLVAFAALALAALLRRWRIVTHSRVTPLASPAREASPPPPWQNHRVTPDQEKLAIVVCGGPAPGINSVIGAATIRACLSNVEVLGIQDGFKWLMRGDTDHVTALSIADTSRIHFRGGSHIGISRESPRTPEEMKNVLSSLARMGIGKLITIGGDGTAFMAHKLSRASQASGGRLKVVHVPKTIDNDIDLPHGASTFGFQTARHVGCEIVENLMVDAKTTSRWYFVVAQGRKAGHLGLAIGKAAGATLSLIPEEFPRETTRFATIVDTLAGAIIKRLSYGRPDGVAMLAEGLAECVEPEELGKYTDVPRDARGNIAVAQINLCDILKIAVQRRLAEFNIQAPIMAKAIGYELRCADPIPFDMEYTRDLGYCAARHIIEGGSDVMVSMQHGRFLPIPFESFIDLPSGKSHVRMVDVTSDRYKIARTYMLRLKPEDFDDELEIERLASVAGVTTEEFARQFSHVVQTEPRNFRLTIPPERSLDPSA